MVNGRMRQAPTIITHMMVSAFLDILCAGVVPLEVLLEVSFVVRLTMICVIKGREEERVELSEVGVVDVIVDWRYLFCETTSKDESRNQREHTTNVYQLTTHKSRIGMRL